MYRPTEITTMAIAQDTTTPSPNPFQLKPTYSFTITITECKTCGSQHLKGRALNIHRAKKHGFAPIKDWDKYTKGMTTLSFGGNNDQP